MNLLLAGLLGLASVCNQSAEDFNQKLLAAENRIAFKNDGGMANGGVCWWHSRLQRAAWALAVFNPEGPRPTSPEALKIIQTLIRQTSVVIIPGYENFDSFSRDFHTLIQQELEQWQLRDGLINQAWIRGISGRSDLPAPTLHQRMDKIFLHFKEARKNNSILWLMLQIKGVVSHASLLLEMTAIENGYKLAMVDSNLPSETVTYEYHVGDTSLSPLSPWDYARSFKMVPYLGYSKDLTRIQSALKNYCR